MLWSTKGMKCWGARPGIETAGELCAKSEEAAVAGGELARTAAGASSVRKVVGFMVNIIIYIVQQRDWRTLDTVACADKQRQAGWCGSRMGGREVGEATMLWRYSRIVR